MIIECAYIHTWMFIYTLNNQIDFLGKNNFNKNRFNFCWFINDEVKASFARIVLLIYRKAPPAVDSVGGLIIDVILETNIDV